MYIVECIPFLKVLNRETLSYFSSEKFEPGTLIKVKIRNKNVGAIVIESRDVREQKSEIKSADFSLKKITSNDSKQFLSTKFLEAVNETANYFCTSSGAIFSQLISSFIIENAKLISSKVNLDSNEDESKTKTRSEISILQTDDDERNSHYKALIREEFAKNKSVFICVPQNDDVNNLKEKLERGIEPYVCHFYRGMKGKEIKQELSKLLKSRHPMLVIATTRWLCLPLQNIGTIVIEKENENGWKTLNRPFIDLRFFVESFARKSGARLIIGDSFLRTETLFRYKQGEISEFESVKWRLPKEINTNIIDLRKLTKKDRDREKDFKVIGDEIYESIKNTSKKGQNTFIFTSRKGLSPSTICRDCGEQVVCSNCSSPMVLYKRRDENIFKCHQCSETRSAAEVCRFCGGWRLLSLGIGIEKIVDELNKNLKEIKIYQLDKDTTPTLSKAESIVNDFYNTKGSVLIGTEFAFSYLIKKVQTTIIASIDSLFSIPDFRIKEKIFRIILQTRDLAKENFLIQSRNPEDRVIDFAIKGNLLDFYKKEIEDREPLQYPPFSIFIKVTIRGTKNFVSREAEVMRDNLKDWNPTIFPSTHEKNGEQAALNAVIKIKKDSYPDTLLISTLKSLPPHFEIKVDPDNLL